jgi:acyl carrier protein
VEISRRRFAALAASAGFVLVAAARTAHAESVIHRFRKMVAKHLGVEESRVVSTARFIEDLGADSLDVVELLLAAEEEFNVEISDDDAIKLQTFGDAAAYLEGHVKG